MRRRDSPLAQLNVVCGRPRLAPQSPTHVLPYPCRDMEKRVRRRMQTAARIAHIAYASSGIAGAAITRQRDSSQGGVMTWDEIKGNWRNYKGGLKEKWGELTDDDLDRIEGKRDQLLGTLQNRYGRTKEAAER